jgi:glycosyltransferase involved in cell wall biosynthesis
MPAYNAGRHIAEAIRSVVAQTSSNWELIVVDDGSADDTAAQVTPFLADPRISLHRRTNGGPSAARNCGVNLAKAEFIAFLDADDCWFPAKLEKQLAVFARYPEVGVCGTGRTMISPRGEVLYQDVRAFRGLPLPQLLFAPLADMSMAVVRREVFEEVGIFDESLLFAEDYEFWLRVGRYFCFHIIPESLVYYRLHEAGDSIKKWMKQRAVFYDRVLPRFLDEQDGRRFVKPWHLWKLKAGYYRYRGDGALNKIGRIGWYLRSILAYPLEIDVYSALGSTAFPAWFWRRMKTLKRGRRNARGQLEQRTP